MSAKADTTPLCAHHAALLAWFTEQGYPAPQCAEDIRATMQPPTDHTPARPEPKQVESVINDGRVWYQHGQVAKMAGISSERLVSHRQAHHIPLTGVRCKDPNQTGVGLRWFYPSDVVETYLAWLKDADARRKAGQAKRIESRKANASNSTTLRGKMKSGVTKNV